MISELKWETLEERRTKQRLAMFYKIHHGLVAVDKDKYIKHSSRVSRHSHNQAYEIPKTGPDYYKFSFFPRTINDWNRLPQSVIDSKTLTLFKMLLFNLMKKIVHVKTKKWQELINREGCRAVFTVSRCVA